MGDRYRLVERLGAGGMSVVWRGFDEVLGRHVAVKLLSAKLAGDERFRERLRQEALAAARLCHPHITAIFDFGETPAGDGPTVPYVVMELIDGESVSARLHRQGPMTWREAVALTAEVASALAFAHARGVVHRDVTPANVMLTPAGAKVVDFGISALIGQRDAAPDGSLLGTPAYLAPERLAGGPVLPATDVYALGVLFYRCLTARLPWPADNTTEALRAHLYAAPEPLPPLPGLPAAVADLCLRCLSKEPDVRPAASDLAGALTDLCASPVRLLPVSHAVQSAAGVSDMGPSAADVSTAGVCTAGIPTAGFAVADVSAAGSVAPRVPATGLPGRRFERPGRRSSRRILAAAALAYFGLPGGVTGSASAGRAQRLRTVLRLGSRLRLGGVQPLGGGVFLGGRFARDLVTGRAVFAGRHRLQVTAGTVALVAVAALVWTNARGPVEIGSAQAAGNAGPAVAALRSAECRVTYRVRRDSGRDFEARLTLHNDGPGALRRWRLDFAYPGDQHLTANGRRVHQDGHEVTVRGDAHGKLAAGRSLTVNLRGDYGETNPMPQRFTLNGQVCDATLLGASGDAADKPAEVEAAGSAEPEK